MLMLVVGAIYLQGIKLDVIIGLMEVFGDYHIGHFPIGWSRILGSLEPGGIA